MSISSSRPFLSRGKVFDKNNSSLNCRWIPLAQISCNKLIEHKQAKRRLIDGLASRKALSEIFLQPSMFNSRSCLAAETNLKKFLDEIGVFDKLITCSDVNNRNSLCRPNQKLEKHLWSRLSFLKYKSPPCRAHREATLTRSSCSRYSNTRGQKKQKVGGQEPFIWTFPRLDLAHCTLGRMKKDINCETLTLE